MKLFGRKQNEIGEEWENLDIKKTKAEDCDWLTSQKVTAQLVPRGGWWYNIKMHLINISFIM